MDNPVPGRIAGTPSGRWPRRTRTPPHPMDSPGRVRISGTRAVHWQPPARIRLASMGTRDFRRTTSTPDVH